jgi:hypothetical protein
MTNDVSATQPRFPDTALYHPWPPLDRRPIAEWLKTMLLFFDGVAVLVARRDRHILLKGQEETVYPLLDAGILHVLDPDEYIDHRVAVSLTDFVLQLATSSQRELLQNPESPTSRAMLGNRWARPRSLSEAERDAFDIVWEEMWRLGLAAKPRPGRGVYLDGAAWQAILAFLAQALRPAGHQRGLNLLPATDNRRMISGFRALARQDRPVSEAQIVNFDLEQVTLDLSQAPIPDLLAFREAHGPEYRRYATDVRRFALELARLPPDEQLPLFRERREELGGEADRLIRVARTWWRRPLASVSIGLAGAAWEAAKDDWPCGIIARAAGVAGAGGKPGDTGAYSYLFRSERTFTPLR